MQVPILMRISLLKRATSMFCSRRIIFLLLDRRAVNSRYVFAIKHHMEPWYRKRVKPACLTFHRCHHVATRQLLLLRYAAGALELGRKRSSGLALPPGHRRIVSAGATCLAVRHEVPVPSERLSGKPAETSGTEREVEEFNVKTELSFSTCIRLNLNIHPSNTRTKRSFIEVFGTLPYAKLSSSIWSTCSFALRLAPVSTVIKLRTHLRESFVASSKCFIA